MSFTTWFETNLYSVRETPTEAEAREIGSDLRALKAEAEALRAKLRLLRQQIQMALSQQQ